MRPLFNILFCCCTRRTSDEQAKDGERRPLLRDNDDAPVHVPRDSLINDRQRIKDRLSSIVQDKQGKMINIADHLLSNHNQRDIASASTSRLRTPSPSPHPSIRTVETETTSESSSSAKVFGDHLLLSKALTLNVRLIRGRDNNYRGNASRGRLGKFGEERGIEVQNAVGSSGLGKETSPSSSGPKNGLNTESGSTEIQPLNDEDRQAILHISNVIKQQLDEGWKIEDPGPISRGWED